MADEPLLIVVSGGQRYAVAQRSVEALQRLAPDDSARPLSDLLGSPAASHEPYVITVSASQRAPLLLQIHQADLRGQLPRLALPEWLARLAHPAIVGLALDGAELIPLIDLVQLAHQTGHETP